MINTLFFDQKMSSSFFHKNWVAFLFHFLDSSDNFTKKKILIPFNQKWKFFTMPVYLENCLDLGQSKPMKTNYTKYFNQFIH